VISGTARGHRLKAPRGNSTRPTADMVKESLFNIIAGAVEGALFLDLFAGTGSIGIEALSRGAYKAVFVEKSGVCCGIIKENLEFTKLSHGALIIKDNAGKAIESLAKESLKFDIIFLDPPYKKNLAAETLKIIVKNDIMKNTGVIIAERHTGDLLPDRLGDLAIARDQKYGDTVLTFYNKAQNKQ